MSLQLSAKLIESGNNEDIDAELSHLKELHRQQMEASEMEMDAEEREHEHRISKNLEDEHTLGIKQANRDIMKKVCLLRQMFYHK